MSDIVNYISSHNTGVDPKIPTIAEALKYYTSADGGTDSIYCAYPDTSDTPKDNKFIRISVI